MRPALVIADPDAMTSLPEDRLRASAMNALAHGAEPLYTPFRNPVATMAALRGAELIATALDQDREERDRAALALGSILCAYALDSALFSLHHVVCQTVVRVCGTPHAETNAAVLPRALEAMRERAPGAIAELAARARARTPSGIGARVEELAGGRGISPRPGSTAAASTTRSTRCSSGPSSAGCPTRRIATSSPRSSNRRSDACLTHEIGQ